MRDLDAGPVVEVTDTLAVLNQRVADLERQLLAKQTKVDALVDEAANWQSSYDHAMSLVKGVDVDLAHAEALLEDVQRGWRSCWLR